MIIPAVKLIHAFAGLWVLLVLMPGIIDAENIRLTVRGDDIGMTQGSVEAFEKAFNRGILTCASLQVVAPWFESAANLVKKNQKWCVGIHLSLIGEWVGYRERPVLPWDKVSSLVDEEGFLYQSPDELWSKKPKYEEIEAEFRAQINLALKRVSRSSISICIT